MGIIRKWAVRRAASYIRQKNIISAKNAYSYQLQMMRTLVSSASHTVYGKEHGFEKIKTYSDFRKTIPLNDYETLRPYIERVCKGESDVLWRGKPKYIAKTSGTISGAKYIPITDESAPSHARASRDALLHYLYHSRNYDIIDKKWIFVQGNPKMTYKHGMHFGRLSGMAAHMVPFYLKKQRMPSWDTNCIDDWDAKVDAIVEETIDQPMSIVSGIPSWLQVYFQKLIDKAGKPVGEIFPDLKLIVVGGANFKPYEAIFRQMIGRDVDTIDLYPASEGFIAYQDNLHRNDMKLLVNDGIFYEFIPLSEFMTPEREQHRIPLWEVKAGVDYAIIVSTNAGLWSYIIGDVVQFTETDPYRIVIRGRTEHFLSAFGEHVIAYEVEQALRQTIIGHPEVKVSEFSVAPCITQRDVEKPYHEWLVEFEKVPNDMQTFAADMDARMCELNIYYKDLIEAKILQPLRITEIRRGGFISYMRDIGKLGEQFKIQRLANDRSVADGLQKYLSPKNHPSHGQG